MRGKNANRKTTQKNKRSPTASSASSGSLAKNLVEQKFLDPDLLAGVGFDVSAYPSSTRFVQQTFASPTGQLKRVMFPVIWKKRYGKMQTEPSYSSEPNPTFYEEHIRTLPSGEQIRTLVPFQGRLVYDNSDTGFSDIRVDPGNPITSKMAWAQPSGRRPYPVGIFPFRSENIEDLASQSQVPLGIIAPEVLPPSPLALRTNSRSSDPRSVALSRSTTGPNSPRPVNFTHNLSRSARSRMTFPNTYVVVRRTNTSKKPKSRSPVSRVAARVGAAGVGDAGVGAAGVGAAGVGAAGVGAAGVGAALPPGNMAYQAQGAILPGSRAGAFGVL